MQGVGDGHAHVGRPEVGEHRPVGELDQAVDQRLRVDDDVHTLVRRPEQVVRLHQLEALVHERG